MHVCMVQLKQHAQGGAGGVSLPACTGDICDRAVPGGLHPERSAATAQAAACAAGRGRAKVGADSVMQAMASCRLAFVIKHRTPHM